jgi:NADH-quinone oxidoreductase subunit D
LYKKIRLNKFFQVVSFIANFNFSTITMPSMDFLGTSIRHIKNNILNFGPQHPAAHGILRIIMQLRGEIIQKADAQFGLLHRGTEKLIEMRTTLQSVPYFDRFDYVANVFQEHAYCLAVEALSVSSGGYDLCLNYTRSLFDELSRILNHLLTLSATSLDLSSMGPIF